MIASLVLIGSLLVAQAPATPPGDAALQSEVHALVRQLNADKKDRREAAEKRLVALGPAQYCEA